MADSALDSLERLSPTLWFVSGGIGVVYASLYGMEAFVGTYSSIRTFLGPAMNVAAFLALLGLYPVLAGRRPWLARVGGFCGALAIVGSFVALLEAAGVVSDEATWFVVSQLVSIVLGMSLAFLAFGVGSLRSELYSRTVGLLLLGPALIMVLNLGIVIAGYASPEGRLLVSGSWAVTYLAIGVTLRTEGGSSVSTTPKPDTSTR